MEICNVFNGHQLAERCFTGDLDGKISNSVTIHAAACHALGIAALYSDYLGAQMVPEASTPPVWPTWKHLKNPLNTHNTGSS